MCGVVSSKPTMPKHLVVAGQSGNKVKVYNCNTKETKTLDGYLKNIGLDNSGNVYVLVCDGMHGWGNYTVYKNYSVYMSFKKDKDIEYSSMAMCVKDNNVVIAGSQVKKFNRKGYEARLVGYNNKVRVYETDWERKSLKYEEFKGYAKITGSGTKTKVEPINENESGCPEGSHLSVVFHVDAVDYCDGYIYATGWGEREYSETPVGYKKQHLVRRCPRVWKNGKEVVQQYENRTGAAWNISVFKYGGKEYIFTSGHQRGQACAWEHSTDQDNFSSLYGYPGVLDEAIFQAGATEQGPIYCRISLCKDVEENNIHTFGRYFQNNKMLDFWGSGPSLDVVAVNSGYYRLSKNKSNRLEVKYEKECVKKPYGFEFERSGTACTLPSDFKVDYAKLAVRE